jgi:YD repeat-containing protein
MHLPKSKMWIFFFAITFVSAGIWVMWQADSAWSYDAPPKDQGHSGPNNDGPDDPDDDDDDPPDDGDPVLITNGSFAYDHLDIYIPGKGSALFIHRYYNSKDRIRGPLGYGWSFMPFAQVIETVKGTDEWTIVRWGNGLRLDFLKNNDGSYQTPVGYYYTLLKTASGFKLSSPDLVDFIFDVSGKLTAIMAGTTSILTFTYDSSGRLYKIEDLNQRALTFAYESGTFTVKNITDFSNRTVTYGYDSNNNLLNVTDTAGGTIRYGYDDAHNLTTMTDERGNVYLSQSYDSTYDRVLSQTYSDGTYGFVYYPSKESGGGWSNAYTRVQRNSHYADYYYDGNGKVTRIYDRTISKNIYMTYDANLNLTLYRDPSNKRTAYSYDDKGNLISNTNFLNQITTIDYHPVFNVVSKITYPSSQAVLFDYTAGGALSKVTLPDGAEISYTYGTDSLSVTETDGTTAFVLDAFNYVSSITDKGGSTTSYTYDAVGNVLTMTDSSGTSRFTYDNKDRMLTATDPASQTTTYTYDAHGNLTSVTSPNGTTHSFAYDQYNRMIDADQQLDHLVPASYNPTHNVRRKLSETLSMYAPSRFLIGLIP